MYFELKNIGAIKHAKIELGKLTVICGKNNTGKTYINYTLYGFLNHLREKKSRQLFKSINKEKLNAETGIITIDLKETEKELKQVHTQLTQLYAEKLEEIFSANAHEFTLAEFHLSTEQMEIDYSNSFERRTHQYDAIKEEKSYILEINLNSSIQSRRLIDLIIDEILFEFFFTKNFPRPFILSAERTGIQLFQKELDRTRSDLVTAALRENRNLALLEEKIDRFALPIEKNLGFTRNTDVTKFNSFLTQEQPQLTTYIEDMLGVQYEIIDGRRVVIDKTTHQSLPHYMSSTSVRALFDLHMWLKHQASIGDILFIDEPELNLHPENQLKIARLLVRLIHSGIYVFITTHSDYIIKELNNLLMLAGDFPDKDAVMKEFGYTPDEILPEEDFKGYIANHDGTLSHVDIDEYGMIQSGFDDAIVQINESSDKIASAINNQ
jgi:predicted ATPase